MLDEIGRLVEELRGIEAIDHRKLSVELVVDFRHVMLEGKRIGSNFERSFLLFLPFLGQGIVGGANDLLGTVYEIAHGHLFLLTFHAFAFPGFPERRKYLDEINFRASLLSFRLLVIRYHHVIGHDVANGQTHFSE